MRILITGASGSGTSTLGAALASSKGWSPVDADDYYWLPTDPPYQEARDHGARLQMILDELGRHETSVVSGSIMNWGAELEDSLALIVFLYVDAAIRVERLRVREQQKLGHADPEFLAWAADYDTGPTGGRSLAKHEAWLAARKCKVLRLEGDLTVERRVELVSDALSELPSSQRQ